MHLAVIDVQNVFGDPGNPWAAPRFAEIVGQGSELVAAFGEAVTFTRFVAPAEPDGAWWGYYAQWPFALLSPDADL